MPGLNESFNELLGYVRPPQMAIAASVMLVLLMAYIWSSRAQQNLRFVQTVLLGVSTLFMVITAVKLNDYNVALDNYRFGQPFPELSVAATLLAYITSVTASVAFANALVQAWASSTWVQRTTLAFGGATLTAACVTVTSGCMRDTADYFGLSWFLWRDVMATSREITVILGAAFVIMVVVVAHQSFRRRQYRQQMLDGDQGCEPRDTALIKRFGA